MSEYTPSPTPDRAWLEARLMHFDDEIRYLRNDLSRMQKEDREDMAELKAMLKEQRAEHHKTLEELNKRVSVLERNKIWLAGWITCASVVVGLIVEICRKQLGW